MKSLFANALTLTGDLVGGKEHYDRALAIYDPAEHGPLTTRSGRDVGVTLLSVRSGCLWQLGYPAASRNDGERAVKNAREIGQAATLMYALWCASWLITSAVEITSLKHSRSLMSFSLWQTKKAPLFWKALGTAVSGRAFCTDRKRLGCNSGDHLGDHLTSVNWSNSLMNRGICGHLAMAYAELGQPDDARRCIDDAIDKVERSMEKWWEAEMHRIAGEIALKSPAPDTQKAEKHFEHAHSAARQQQMKSIELRAAISLARLWRDQGKPQQARELLAPVYGWFTEGFDTRDLKEAKALLEELAS